MAKLSEDKVREALSDVYDPELHVDIVSLGLVYKVEINDENDINVVMTFTFPGCPYGPALYDDVTESIKKLEGVRNVNVDVTFEPAWTPDKINPDVRAALGI